MTSRVRNTELGNGRGCLDAHKHALYLRLTQLTDSVPKALQWAGWTVDECADLRAVATAEQCAPAVGVVRVGSNAQEQVRELLKLFDSGHWSGDLPWLCLVEREAMNDQASRELMTRHCDDCLALPATPALLTEGLEHCFESGQMHAPAALSSPLIGESAALRRVKAHLRRVAPVEATVLITGPSGTGKELAAHSIHRYSGRSGPFVAVNCAAIPPDLIQSELFGHEKGAFTGAEKRHIGRIEAARDGCIFLDEIGDLSLDLQSNLLRFLDEGRIDRVGGQASVGVDVRVIAATHVDLEQAVDAERFREDLYYRLNVLSVEMPPLAERSDDIELLAYHFLKEFQTLVDYRVKGFTSRALLTMQQYPWPGNVRELKNRILKAVVACDGKLIRPENLGLSDVIDRDVVKSSVTTLAQARAQAECEAIEHALRRCRSNVSQASRLLRVSRLTLYRLMDKHNLKSVTRRGSRSAATLEREMSQ